jgi:hypothetical protein
VAAEVPTTTSSTTTNRVPPPTLIQSQIPFVLDYTILTQHWGIMVALMGAFMIAIAFKVEWRKPILIYSLFEKAFMVYLVLANGSHSYSQGFKPGAAMDATVVLYTIVYFAVFGFANS